MRTIHCCVIVILLFTAAPLAAAERFYAGGVRIRDRKGAGEPIV